MARDVFISILRMYYNQGWVHQTNFTHLIGAYIDIFGSDKHKENKQLFLNTLKELPRYHKYCLEYAIDELVNYYSVVKIVKIHYDEYTIPGISEEIVTVY